MPSVRAAAATAAVLALAMLPALPAAAVRTDIVTIPEGTPVAVAIGFSQLAFDTAEEVLLGRDDLFADSLASGGLQGTERPLLLTDADELDPDVLAEITRLGADTVILLGGEAAVSADVADALEDEGLDVERRAGVSRTETAIDVAADLDATTALLVRAFPGSGGDQTQAFADSIAGGAWAADEGWPVLFTQTEVLTGSTATYLEESGITDVVVIGGEAAVSADVTDALDEMAIGWERVSGSNRFATATAIAEARGFDSEADADQVVLVEGQTADAWVGGFTAAAYAAIVDAPIVLSNGEDLPPATEVFLDGPSTRVDEDDVDGVVLVCASDPAACEDARVALGLPDDATLTITSGTLEPGEDVTGTLEADDPAVLSVSGCGRAIGATVPVAADGSFTIPLPASQTTSCTLSFEVQFANGSVQLETRTITITVPDTTDQRSGTIIAFDGGANTYTFVMAGGTQVAVAYDAQDRFAVQGTTASELGFESTIGANLGNTITFTDDVSGADDDLHNLTSVGPVQQGQIADVDVAATTFAFVEPFSQTVLRTQDWSTADGNGGYRVGSTTLTLATFGDELNEGDSVAITNPGSSQERMTVTNGTVQGVVSAVTDNGTDVTFRIAGRGDDPATNQDTDFVANDTGDTFTGQVADTFAEFQAEVDDGDTVTYARTGGVESFQLANSAPPTVSGTVTNATDGNNVVTYLPGNGAAATTFDHTGAISYRVDNAIVVEAELEAALTPGDQVTFTPDNPNTGPVETAVSLTNANLSGRPADVQIGAQTLDVRNGAGGTVADDLSWVTPLYAGPNVRYDVSDQAGEQTLAEFEAALGTIDAGSSLTASPLPGGLGTLFTLTP